ncbi:MAG: CapA family protein [Planctomycetia bacterium]|nr:CapA family protein [Planctomycetia bacterium]
MSISLRFAALLLAIVGLAVSANADEPTVRLAFVGDVMLADLPGKVIERGDDPFAHFATLLHDADFTVGNLECVISTRGAKVEKPWNFRADPRCAPLLAKYFNAVSIANNHTGDYGPEAFVEQLEYLKGAKVPAFGGGRNRDEAHQPLVVELKGIRIALLGYNEFKPRAFEATDKTPGVAWSVDQHVVADIAAARKVHHADLVIPFMHWGREMETAPSDRQKQFARMMIDAGADVVVGGHPHCTEGTDIYRGKLIVYSLGNFVFDGFDPGIGRTGWLLRLTLNRQGLVKWDTVVAEIDAEGIPRPNLKAKSPQGVMVPPVGK